MGIHPQKPGRVCTYPLREIYFYLTGGCNLRCRHCWIAPAYQTTGRPATALSLDLFRSIVDQAKPLGLRRVKFTGGEPLLHPQIQDILKCVRAEGLGLNVETNGVLCTPDLAGEIAGCTHPFVAVSLDGAEPETHEWMRGVEGCFEASLAGIRTLVTAGLTPQVIMTLTRRNRDQIEAMVRLAESMGAGSVKFNVIQPVSRGERMVEAHETLTLAELVDLGHWVENTLSATTDLRIAYDHPPVFRPLGKMFGKKGNGCSTCGILGILGALADGSYALCGIGETVPDLVFGDGATDRLETVWTETPLLRELRAGLPHRLEGICGDCLMRNRCLGSCMALNYYQTKRLWAPFWYCEQARQQGLFPESRLAPEMRPSADRDSRFTDGTSRQASTG
jgi:SynChlorMet cassette radical SAM/SPASM protein ScmF